MSRKKLILVILGTILLAAIVGIVIWQWQANKLTNNKQQAVYPPQPSVNDLFKWGATVRPFALDPEMKFKPALDEQFTLMEELGAKWVRTDWLTQKGWDLLDETLEAARRHGLGVVLIVDWQQEGLKIFEKSLSPDEIEKKAYQFANDLAKRYKGKIHYYQISAEMSSLALANPLSAGFLVQDYDNSKYQRIYRWIKGTTEGIKAADPEAKRIIDSLWTHTGFIDRLVADKIEFEVIGWDWYSNFGIDLGAVDIHAASGRKYNLVEELGKYGKEVWIAEANKSSGTLDGNLEAQARFTEDFARYIYSQPLFTGFMFYELTDRVGVQEGELFQGLVQYRQEGDHFVLDKNKPAFQSYRKVIKESSGR